MMYSALNNFPLLNTRSASCGLFLFFIHPITANLPLDARDYKKFHMINLMKKTMLAGVGLAVVTKEKIFESINELVDKGKLTTDEANALSEKIVEEGRVETEKAKSEAGKLLNELLHRANVVTKDQYDELATRVTELEGRLHKEFPNID